MKREKRCINAAVELRENDKQRVLVGTPIIYNSPSELIYGYFQERIKPGAFDKCLAKQPDIMCLRDHKAEWILGRVSSKTLRIIPSDNGISIECDMPNTTYALDLAESIRRGDLKGMSFGFDVITDEWYMKDKVRTRDVLEADLFEVTFTTIPAYPDTEVGLRDVDAFKAEIDKKLKIAMPKLRRAKTLLKIWDNP